MEYFATGKAKGNRGGADAAPDYAEGFEGVGEPAGWSNTIVSAGTVDYDYTTEAMEGSKALEIVTSGGDTYAEVDLGVEYADCVFTFAFKVVGSGSNRSYAAFLDATHSNNNQTDSLGFGNVSSWSRGVDHNTNNIQLLFSGTVNAFHYMRVEVRTTTNVIKIARSNDENFPTSGTNYAEDLAAGFNAAFTGVRYLRFGGESDAATVLIDDVKVWAL
jgi:hypothetical protein